MEPATALKKALADCQAAVDGAAGLNAKNISEKDAANGYSISGFILNSCMSKQGFECVQPTHSDPCSWRPLK